MGFNAAYLICILIVAFFSIAVGFRKGLTRQLDSLLGFGFGGVAARIFTPEYAPSFHLTDSWCLSPEFRDFTANLVCGVLIYTVVFAMFSLLSGLFRSAMSVVNVGMFNRIMGSIFSLIKNLLWLSIVFNLLLCFSSESRLLSYERANDGNLIAAVMDMTPAILGCYGAEDFAHYHQLKEAKTISCNFRNPQSICVKKLGIDYNSHCIHLATLN